jgi:hypothetical protein
MLWAVSVGSRYQGKQEDIKVGTGLPKDSEQ